MSQPETERGKHKYKLDTHSQTLSPLPTYTKGHKVICGPWTLGSLASSLHHRECVNKKGTPHSGMSAVNIFIYVCGDRKTAKEHEGMVNRIQKYYAIDKELMDGGLLNFLVDLERRTNRRF